MALKQAAIFLCCVLSLHSAVVVGKPFNTYVYDFPVTEDLRGPVRVGKQVKFKQCGGVVDAPDITSVDIDPCDAEPCIAVKGSTIKTTVVFTPKKPLSHGILHLDAIMGGIKIPLHVDQPDICQGHNLTCPLEPGQEQTFKLSQEVKRYYPPGEITLQSSVLEGSKMVFCIRFQIKIVSHRQDVMAFLQDW